MRVCTKPTGKTPMVLLGGLSLLRSTDREKRKHTNTLTHTHDLSLPSRDAVMPWSCLVVDDVDDVVDVDVDDVLRQTMLRGGLVFCSHSLTA